MVQEKLSKGEILVILVLLARGGQATVSQIANILKASEQYVRNIITKLRRRGIIKSLGSSELRAGIIFGSPLFPEISIEPKQKVHILTMDLSQLLKKYPEILKWTGMFKISSQKELEEYLKKLGEEWRL
jgi:DNA-binding Lrp family transcriptional regulator